MNDEIRPRRYGLTLVEMLVVILIIGILMAILIPAVAGAFQNAKQAQVTAEISNLATALADFRNKFGEYPPSRLYCSERGYYPKDDALAQRSLKYLRKFWPRVQFSTTENVIKVTSPAQGVFYDFNGDGVCGILKRDGVTALDTSYVLNGPECLAFFLGGIPRITTPDGVVSFTMSGFGKNPLNPFVSAQFSNNRIAPLYEFAPGRLDDADLDPLAKIPNNVPCYLDTLGTGADTQPIAAGNTKRPFAYFYSYGAGSYDPEDYNAASEVDSSNVPIGRQFSVSFQAGLYGSVGPNPYTVSGPVVFASGSTEDYTPATFQNANSFQLMSAGLDRLWGIGGQYTSSGNEHAPFTPKNTNTFYDAGAYVTAGDTGNPRTREADNLTNFSGGRIN